jgi:hypothetical protein
MADDEQDPEKQRGVDEAFIGMGIAGYYLVTSALSALSPALKRHIVDSTLTVLETTYATDQGERLPYMAEHIDWARKHLEALLRPTRSDDEA